MNSLREEIHTMCRLSHSPICSHPHIRMPYEEKNYVFGDHYGDSGWHELSRIFREKINGVEGSRSRKEAFDTQPLSTGSSSVERLPTPKLYPLFIATESVIEILNCPTSWSRTARYLSQVSASPKASIKIPQPWRFRTHSTVERPGTGLQRQLANGRADTLGLGCQNYDPWATYY